MVGSQCVSSAIELVVLDPAGRIRFSSALASAGLASGDVVCRLRDGVSAPSRSGRDALDRLIRGTLADAAARAPAVPRVVPLARHGRLPLVAVGLPIAGPRRCDDFELGAALLLRDPEAIQLPSHRIVREAFGLTRAECEVALSIGADRSLKEIAADRACSLNTVRTLTGRVLQKTGCRRQSELVRVLGALNEVLAAAAGMGAGLGWAGAAFERLSRKAARRHCDALLRVPLRAPVDHHATVVSRGFSPGDDTGFHLHECGHEIVCIVEGSLTMEYLDRPPCATGVGEAIYVAPGVIHRGVNADTRALSLFHVGIGPAGRIDRREV